MNAAPLWTAVAAARATGGEAVGEWSARGVSIDSRSVATGDLFVALEGENFDGHDFAAAALDRGAAAVMLKRRVEGVSARAPSLLVEDTLDGLENLGRAARTRTGAKIAAITGSVGKTGVKQVLAHVLSHQGSTAYSRGSFNNRFGVPLSLARMPADSAYGVFELGMNHVGELTPLTAMVRPHVAAVTNIEIAHMAFFDSLEAIADAKAEIFTGVVPGGTAVLNRDNGQYDRLRAAAERAGIENFISFGAAGGADFRLIGANGSAVTAMYEGTTITYVVGIPGRHWVINSLAVLATVSALGGDVVAAAASLGGLEAPSGRGARIAVRAGDVCFVIIDESYNASPAAVRAALAALAEAEPGPLGRRIAVLGDMLELGDRSTELHRALAAPLAEYGIDRVFAAGPLMRRMYDALPLDMQAGHADTSEGLAPLVAAAVGSGDVVMVKGSLGSRMRRIVDALAALDRPAQRAVNGN
jgi:UDP-N-acetylmuramoyl-tripeptide--D-alanyl-D-alanine ligase